MMMTQQKKMQKEILRLDLEIFYLEILEDSWPWWLNHL